MRQFFVLHIYPFLSGGRIFMELRMQRSGFVLCFFMLMLTLISGQCAWAGPHEDYVQGQQKFMALLANSKKAELRSEWLAVLALFEKSVRADSKGADAPKCMYFIGRIHEELGRRSAVQTDRQNALDAFERMRTTFPKHGWADDSLFRQGLIWKDQLKNAEQARAIFQAVLTTYPQGDMAAEARIQLSALGKSAPTAQSAPAAAPTPAKAPTKQSPATLKSIRHWSSNEYTRVVLDVDALTSYERKVLTASSGTPQQLQIDLPQARIDADVMPSRTISDGILSHIHVGSLDAGGARVTLDLLQMDHYRAFTLPDPCRIVIDVFGEPATSAKTARKASSSAPAPGTHTAAAETPAANHVESALTELKAQQKTSPAPSQATPAPKAKSTTQAAVAAQPEPAAPDFTVSPKQKKMAGTLVEQLGLTVRTIMIDPGHGGKDPGAIAHGIQEKDVNLRMAKIMGKMLEAHGFEVAYTRTTDVFIPLEERTARANAKNADLFISLHCNAYKDGSIKGLEMYYLNLATDAQAVRVAARENGISEKKISDMQFILSDLMLNSKINESRQMAAMMQQEAIRGLRKKYQVTNHGAKGAFFYVLTGARMPAVLVELGYLTNTEEAALLKTDAYLQTLAQGLVGGVVAYKKHLERYAAAPAKKKS